MRKEIFRMDRAAAVALLERTPVVHLASTTAEGRPLLRTLHGVVVRGAVAFHGAPAGEKIEAIGREAVISAEETVASIPSYFLDPERACPATTLYRSAQVHGLVEEVSDAVEKAEVLSALMRKYQPEGGHVPITAEHPLYRKAVVGILVLKVPLGDVDGKAKLGQNRTPEEQKRLMERLWERGAPGDREAIELVRAANPGAPLPAFLAGVEGAALTIALDRADAERAAELLDGAYWNTGVSRETLTEAHLGSSAWVGARDEAGTLVATARAIGDGAKRAWIYDVMVAPEWRNRGLGQAVMRLLLEHPALRRVHFIHLATRDAQRLYERLGFVDRQQAFPARPYVSTEMVLIRPSGEAS